MVLKHQFGHCSYLSLSCRSYSQFQYSNLKVSPATIKAGQNVTVDVTVANVGSVAGDEVCVCMCACVCVCMCVCVCVCVCEGL